MSCSKVSGDKGISETKSKQQSPCSNCMHWPVTIDIERPKIDCLSFVYVPATSAAHNRLFFLLFLLRLFTVLMKKTHAVKQSIFLRCLCLWHHGAMHAVHACISLWGACISMWHHRLMYALTAWDLKFQDCLGYTFTPATLVMLFCTCIDIWTKTTNPY